ncbi:MAG: DNA polymerase Y family protein, partial [Zoogloeaceae bacterium]|nr:DNA polymerase Y family protein [Zoogloeaceae bacterium]
RRFGPGLPEQLARALGQVPDPRPPFSFPQAFSQRLELPAKVERAEHLLFAARRLLLALGGWLAAHASGIRACRLILVQDDTPASELPLAFATPTRDPDRLVRVLRERLERLNLAAPVTELRLDADTPEPLPGRSGGLFGDSTAEAIAPVMERLRARLGQEAVHGLAAVADHRPECATRPTRLPGESPLVPVGPRPLGLLPAPEALEERRGQPWRHGRLRLLTRSERIESGWWDGGEGPGDQRRDYFVALSEAGEWLWIFQDRHGWWLHGYFA